MAEIIHEHDREPEKIVRESDRTNFIVGLIVLIVFLILLFAYILPGIGVRTPFVVPENLFAPPSTQTGPNIQINPPAQTGPNIQIPAPDTGNQGTPSAPQSTGTPTL